MKPVLADLLAYLRCPASQSPLTLSEDGSLTAADGRRYPVVDGVPILIAGERSLFDSAAFELWGTGPGPSRGLRGRLRRGLKWILGLPPTAARNIGTRENYLELRRLLSAGAGSRAAPGARVLIVGGGDAGVGIEPILSDPALELVETDVYLGPRVGVVCDAHDLPFLDASFDAVICQAVLEHVIDPGRVTAEIWRVLKTGGLVYSEVPFMQQVHAGAFDFTRFTLVGHRLLWRRFDELRSGAQGGPGMALIWSIGYFLRAPCPRPLWPAVDRLVTLGFFWLKYADGALVRRAGGLDGASGTFFLGRRRADAIPDRQLVRGYRGGGPKMTW